ncbi:transcription factor 7-like 1 [Centropristis striata]|uniref:transcription factor 7-like 1 n=1 Tax=Centropristis striata TaxID=184440 RepID=UPI0027DF8A04|nr:transcription factor 7-like 1 [Centropristis striata]
MGADPLMLEQQGPVMAAPSMHQSHSMQPAHLQGQTAAYSQGQYRPYHCPVHNVLTAPASLPPPPPPQTYRPYHCPVHNVLTAPASLPPPPPPQQTVNKAPVVTLKRGQGLRCVGMQNGEMVYEVTDFSPPRVSAAPPLSFSESKKTKRESQQEEERPYVKRPPNAFMLFLKEQRSAVEDEGKGTAITNKVLGEKWRSLTEEQKKKYNEQAAKERQLHAERYPDWSVRENYGKKRMRREAPSKAGGKTILVCHSVFLCER